MLENTGQNGNSQKTDLSSFDMKTKITPTTVWLTTAELDPNKFTFIFLNLI